MRKLHLALVMVLALGVSDLARAGAPTVFTVQGVLRNNSGQLQSMVLNVTVSFFNVQTGGTALATYNNNMVQAQNGLFTFNISDASIGGVLQAQSQLWMEVAVAGFGTFPRTQVTSQLYSLSSASADSLSSACVGCVADSNIGSVAGTKVTGTVNSANTANSANAIQGETVSPTPPTSGQVLQWNGSQWVPTSPSGGTVGGTGVATTIPIWSSATQLGNSPLTFTSGNLSYSGGGRINLTAGGSNAIDWGTAGAAPPSQNSVGWKMRTWDNGWPWFGIGIDGFTQWYVADNFHDFYTTDGASFAQVMRIEDGGIELGGNNGLAGTGTPFIDFHLGGAGVQDYNVRLINDASQQLTLAGGNLAWGNGSQLNTDQGGSIELGGNNSLAGFGIPYIDFHVGGHGIQDFNVRLINDGDQQLSLVGGNFRMPPDKRIFFQNPTTSPPSSIGGWRIVTNQNNSALVNGIGVDTVTQWYVGNRNHAWYSTADGTSYTQNMSLSNSQLRLLGSGSSVTIEGDQSNQFSQFSNSFNVAIQRSTGGVYDWYGPSAKLMRLDNAGNLYIAASYIANGVPDVAETIATDEAVSIGDVVCADPARTEHAVRCKQGPVLGVISDGTSAVLINSHGPRAVGKLTGKPLVLAGRVPVKVSLENGPIQIGDLLTLSSTPGVAMRMTAPGPQVGIALASFDGKRGRPGTVLTFVKVGEGHMADEVRQIQKENAELRAEVRLLRQAVERLAADRRGGGAQPAVFHR